MKKLIFALAALMAVVPQLLANDILPKNLTPVVYLDLPFGGSTKSTPSYGLQFTRGGFSLDESEQNSSPLNGAPVMDLRFRGNELDAFSIHGINTLNKQTILHLDGTTTTEYSVNWWLVGGLAALGGAWWMCEENDWDLCGGDHGDKKKSCNDPEINNHEYCDLGSDQCSDCKGSWTDACGGYCIGGET